MTPKMSQIKNVYNLKLFNEHLHMFPDVSPLTSPLLTGKQEVAAGLGAGKVRAAPALPQNRILVPWECIKALLMEGLQRLLEALEDSPSMNSNVASKQEIQDPTYPITSG